MTSPSDVLLELVDPTGTTIGVAEKLAAHVAPGQLHRAFSVFLFAPDGRMLLPEGPGIGADVDLEFLESITTRRAEALA